MQALATEVAETKAEPVNGAASNGNGANGNGNGNGAAAVLNGAATVIGSSNGAALLSGSNGNGNGRSSSGNGASTSSKARMLNTIDEEQNAPAAGHLEMAAATGPAAAASTSGKADAPRAKLTAAGTPYKNPGGRWSKFKSYSVFQVGACQAQGVRASAGRARAWGGGVRGKVFFCSFPPPAESRVGSGRQQ